MGDGCGTGFPLVLVEGDAGHGEKSSNDRGLEGRAYLLKDSVRERKAIQVSDRMRNKRKLRLFQRREHTVKAW
jgi:hypothetical protein